jgi:hypothetical protein
MVIDQDMSVAECENSLRIIVILLNSCPTLCFCAKIVTLFGDLLVRALKKPLVLQCNEFNMKTAIVAIQCIRALTCVQDREGASNFISNEVMVKCAPSVILIARRLSSDHSYETTKNNTRILIDCFGLVLEWVKTAKDMTGGKPLKF